MSHDPRKIAQLLDMAAVLPSSERNAFLETACGGDHNLRRHLELLLSSREFSDSALETPTAIQPGFESHAAPTGACVADPEATITRPESRVPEDTLIADPDLPGGNPVAASGPASPVVIAGRYTLVELLGHGGMGEVWVAHQSEPVKRRVALKLIKGGMDSRDVVNRFEAERQALAMMEHPSIARILDGGLTEGRLPYFVMELVDGQPLTRFCDAARMTIRQRLELFVSICKGVQHAHQKGIVHRDLKPGNILVGFADGRPIPKVIDFGLAKATQGKLTEETLATTFGAVVGTLDYMSPEQAGLSGGDVDTRSDIYSLGVILYELLTGLRPIESKGHRPGGLTEVIRRIQEEEPPRPSARLATSSTLAELAAARATDPRTLTALLRGELDWVVMKCLEKQRDRRYETVNALARDVERHLTNEPVEARPPNTKYRVGKFLQRNKGPVIAASLVFLTLVGGIIGTAIGLVRAMRAEGVLADEARRADDARQDAERQLAHGLIAQGDALTLASRIPEAYARYNEAYDKFVELKEPLLVPEAALWDFAQRTGLPLLRTEVSNPVDCVAVFPDNRTALVGTQGGELWVWDLATGRRIRTLHGHTDWISGIAISPDGATAVSASGDKTLKLWDLASGSLIRTFLGHTDRVHNVAMTPDGKRALSASCDGTLKLWDLADGGELRTLTGHTDEVLCVAIFPDGLTALSGSGDKTLKVWDLATGEVRRTFAGHAEAVRCVAISSDGELALSGSDDRTVRLWDLSRGVERRTYLGHAGILACVAFTPDGTAAFSGSHDGTLRVWGLENGETRRSYGDMDQINCTAISADGRFALSGSQGPSAHSALTLWELPLATGRGSGRRAELPLTKIVVSADGRSVLTDGWGPTMKSWDLAGENVLNTIAPDQPDLTWFLLAANGRTALAQDFGDSDSLVLDLTTGASDHRLSGHAARVTCGELSPDGRTALTGSEDTTLKLWDLTTGVELRTLSGHTGPVRCTAFAPDGQTALSGSDDKTLRIWDLVSGRMLRSFSDDSGAILSVSISADGVTALCACSDATLKLWNLQSGELLRTLSGHTEPHTTARMTDDGRFALSAGFDKTMRLWDLAGGKELRKFSGHKEPVISLGASPDGRTALTGDIAGNLMFWNFSRATAHREFERRVAAAQTTLRRESDDPSALATLGEWYAFRGLDHWGVEFLLRARDRGAVVPGETLGRCYWNLARFAEAEREFQSVVEQSTDRARREYFSQCLRTVKDDLERARRRNLSATAAPLLDADIERISRLSGADQITEVQGELRRRNPEFDASLIPTLEGDVVVGLVVPIENVTDLAPLRALTRLRTLELKRNASSAASPPVNLAPLAGLSLTRLDLARSVIAELSPLRGMPLEYLNLQRTRVSDLSPLAGMPLIQLNLMSNPVSNLSPLEGMPLEVLSVDFTRVADLTPLRGMPLKHVTVDGARVVSRLEAEALRFQEAEDWQGAAGVWRNAVESYALEDLHVSARLIEALLKIRDFAGAVSVYQRALQFVPSWKESESHEETFGPEHLRRTRDSILDAFASVGRFDEAIELGRKLVQERPEDAYTALRLSILLATTAESAGYREHCRWMNRQYASSVEPLPVWVACSACLLTPDDELTQLARKTLAESGVLKKPLDQAILRSATQFTRALLALRLGDAKAALQMQQEAAKSLHIDPVESPLEEGRLHSTKEIEGILGSDGLRCIRAKHLTLIALAQHQLGHPAEAAAALRQAEEFSKQFENDNPDTLYDRLEFQILLQEARKSLGDAN